MIPLMLVFPSPQGQRVALGAKGKLIFKEPVAKIGAISRV